jgi:DNA-binding CsgD family transcriptional regulator
MSRAAEIASRLAEARDTGALDAFEQLGCAAILLDFLGRTQRMNQRARKYLGKAVIVTDGQLATAHKDSNAAFQQLIADLLQPAPSVSGAPILAHLPRPDARPLIAYGMPISRSAQEIFHHSRAILVMVDPDENQSPPEIVLRHGFKLTPAECRLTLALGEGATVSEFAARQGISVGTARIQLKAVMAKMATRRQSELVALLARLSRAHANG